MNQILKRLLNGLRSLRSDTADETTSCWVQQCSAVPMMVLAASDQGAIVSCREHARQWVTSDACRFAAEQSAVRSIAIVRRWTADVGPEVSPHGSGPRNDIFFLRQNVADL